MRCPTLDDLTQATLNTLPRGRAWQTNDGGPYPGRDIAFTPTAFANEAFDTSATEQSFLWKWWRSYAVMLDYFHQRLCALRQEFWCQTVSETRDEWMFEYGLPDACDPFPDLCTKVAAIGGTRCEYYQAIAVRLGWVIECVDQILDCGSRTCSRAGRARAGATRQGARLRVIVHLGASTAYKGGRNLTPRAGRMRSGRRMSCGPDISPLICILSRVVHAELQIVYDIKDT